MINEFKDKYFFLSNFKKAPITYLGLNYKSSEAAYQSMKCCNEEDRIKFIELSAPESKKLGREITPRSDWEEIKDNVMYEICKAKFSQNEDLKEKLLETKDKYLEEGNTWHDNIWGNCKCEKCKNIPGENRLGKTLMRVREELRNQNTT